MSRIFAVLFLLVCVPLWAQDNPEDIAHVWNQTFEMPIREVLLHEWNFDKPDDLEGWTSPGTLKWQDGALMLQAGGDPQMYAKMDCLPKEKLSGTYRLRIYLRNGDGTFLETYLSTESAFWQGPNFLKPESPDPVTVELTFESKDPLKTLRIDPSTNGGEFLIDKIELFAVEFSPLAVTLEPAWSSSEGTPYLQIVNKTKQPVTAKVNGNAKTFAPGPEKHVFGIGPRPAKTTIKSFSWTVEMPGFEPIKKSVTLIPEVPVTANWQTLKVGAFQLRVSPEKNLVYVFKNGKNLGSVQKNLGSIQLEPGTEISVGNGFVEFTNASGKPMSSPTLRINDPMKYALMPGIEMLEEGEWSSSKQDFQLGNDNIRVRPNPDWLTQQWMGIITLEGTFRMQWKNAKLQPEFAIPNYFDGTPDSRLGLELGAGDSVRLYLSDNTDISAFHVAGVREQLANFSRKSVGKSKSKKEQFKMYRKALMEGPLYVEGKGWGHLVEHIAAREPYAGIASAVYLMGMKVPEFPQWTPGGAHVGNNTIYRVTGKEEDLRKLQIKSAGDVLNSMQPDGSFPFAGNPGLCQGWRQGAELGTCASRASCLLEGWQVTKEDKYLEAAKKVLDYCKRFQIPRGAQGWEMPLHTPDPLAGAHAVGAYTLAYKITKIESYRECALYWANSGLTYMYLWDTPERPFQYGAYIGVLGATHRNYPNWIGRPVQWIGTVYTNSLLDLAEILPSEEAAFWTQMAEELTVSCERQIVDEGDYTGLLPDSVDPVKNVRNGLFINPSAPVLLRLRLDEKH